MPGRVRPDAGDREVAGGGAVAPTRAVAPLVGRDAERAILADALARLAEGRGGAVFVEGDPGIGKTRLVESVLWEAEARGHTTAFASADPIHARRPFELARALAADLGDGDDEAPDQALVELLESVRRRSSSIALAPPGSARVAVIDALVGEVELRARSPFVLVTEDLQWADEVSLAALGAVLRLVAELPLLVIASARPAVGHDPVADVRAEFARLGSVIRLGELRQGDVARLAAEMLGAEVAPSLISVLDQLGGNPYLIIEVLSGLSADGALRQSGDTVGAARSSVDAVVSDVATRRLHALDADVLDLLRVASVIGTAFSVRDLVAITGRSASSLGSVVSAAISTGSIVEHGAELRFAHQLVCDAVYEGLPLSQRAALHEDAAQALAARGAAPVVVATHAALGASPERAVALLHDAATDVMSLAPSAALSLLDEALALGITDPAVLAMVQRARIESLLGVGRIEEAERLATLLVDQPREGLDRGDLLIRLSSLLVLLNRTAEAIAHLDAAAEEASTDAERALALAYGALARMTVADLDGARHRADEAVAFARATGNVSARTLGSVVLGRLPSFSHDYRAGLPAALDAVETADSDPTGRAHDLVPWFWLGVLALDLDDAELLARSIGQGRHRADEGFAAWAHPLYCGLAASAHHRHGELDQARAEALAGVSLAIDTGSTQARMWCESLLALVADLQGETDEQAVQAAAAASTWERTNAMLGIDHFALAGAAGLGPAEARAHLGGAWDLFAELSSHNCHPLLAVPLARATHEHDRARLDLVVDAVSAARRRDDLPSLVALEMHVRGIANQSSDELEQAAAAWGELGRRLDRAEALADAARTVAATDERRSSRLLGEAVAAFTACDAEGAAARLESELGGPGHDRRPARESWESLTPTEVAVAVLVGDGLTNSEIAERRHVSRRTIESHLIRIYAKIGHSSRTRLAVEASERSGS